MGRSRRRHPGRGVDPRAAATASRTRPEPASVGTATRRGAAAAPTGAYPKPEATRALGTLRRTLPGATRLRRAFAPPAQISAQGRPTCASAAASFRAAGPPTAAVTGTGFDPGRTGAASQAAARPIHSRRPARGTTADGTRTDQAPAAGEPTGSASPNSARRRRKTSHHIRSLPVRARAPGRK